jgi:YegS/Rv2252/BmrU family lipid kinase
VRCVLIYNPASGRNRQIRAEKIRQISIALSALGHNVEVRPTTAPGSATIQAEEAVRSGAEVVFACGGDGTIHEILQSMVTEASEPTAALGIIPLGSANALARHMRLSLDPVDAALQEVAGTPHTIPVGKITFGDHFRYFAVMAGAGPDGALVYDLLTAQKSSLGRLAYYLRAAKLFATRRFDPFVVEYDEASSGAKLSQRAVSVMAVRVGDLGGLFSKLTGPGGTVHDAHLKLLVLGPPAALSLPLWFVSGWLNLNGHNRFLSIVDVTRVSCHPYPGSAAHFQADGECLGRIPMQITVIPKALRLLLPNLESVRRR